MRHIVYMTINKVNKKIYIGVHSTENPSVFDGYLGCGVTINSPSSYNRSKSPFQFAVKKYGPSNFIRITLKEFNIKEDAFKLEREIVSNEFISRRDTYNATIGGGSAPRQDKIIYQYSLDGNYIQTWSSIKEASEKYNCSGTAISNAISINGSSCGYYWSDLLLKKLNVEKYTSNNNDRIVYQYNSIGELINEYESIIATANELKVLQSAIGRAIKGEYKVNGFNFSFAKLDLFKSSKGGCIKNKNIHLYNSEGVYIKTFKTPREAADFLCLKSTSKISSAIRLDRSIDGYKFSLDKYESIKPIENGITKPKKVGQYDLNGMLIFEYPTITSASEAIGQGVKKVLKNQIESYKGFVFKYL